MMNNSRIRNMIHTNIQITTILNNDFLIFTYFWLKRGFGNQFVIGINKLYIIYIINLKFIMKILKFNFHVQNALNQFLTCSNFKIFFLNNFNYTVTYVFLN